MKVGTVVCLVGTGNLSDDFDDCLAASELGLEPGSVIFSAREPGYYDMMDALRLLIQAGFKYIHAIQALRGLDGRMRSLGEPQRLFG